jgi:hypothetical protein
MGQIRIAQTLLIINLRVSDSFRPRKVFYFVALSSSHAVIGCPKYPIIISTQSKGSQASIGASSNYKYGPPLILFTPAVKFKEVASLNKRRKWGQGSGGPQYTRTSGFFVNSAAHCMPLVFLVKLGMAGTTRPPVNADRVDRILHAGVLTKDDIWGVIA